MRHNPLILIVAVLTIVGCTEASRPIVLEESGETSSPTENSANRAAEDDESTTPAEEEMTASTETVRGGEAPTEDTDEKSPTSTTGAESNQTPGPPDTSKQQMSYIFLAHPDDEIGAWSPIENSSGNYHVFVLLTRGGHTGYCENPQNKTDVDNYEATPRDSEACKENRVTSFHRFLNRAGTEDPYLDVISPDDVALSDTDSQTGRYDVWVGPNSARVIFDFADGGLDAENLLDASELVRALKGNLLPDLPDYQAMAGSFWNANYPDCAVYDHPDHRAVHVAVYRNDLETTVQRGSTCDTDPDAVYFREISEATWRILAGSPNYLEDGGDPGIYRRSYGWLNPGWEMSEDHSKIISREQSFWERRF